MLGRHLPSTAARHCVLGTALQFEIRVWIRPVTVVITEEMIDENIHVARGKIVTVIPELFFDATAVDTSDFVVGQYVLD